jgi:transcriptional regulator with XRE-family HTH domain
MAGQLTTQMDLERWQAKFAHQQASDVHQETVFEEWQVRSAARGKAAPAAMLGEIGSLGFAWRDVARMLGVSVAAVQKWRRGEGVTGTNRRKIASLLAFCDMITQRHGVDEIASWFEMPLTADCPVTPIDMYAEEQPRIIFDYAGNHSDPEQALTEFDPEWRERYRSSFEVYEAADGELSIRAKGN